jgi:heme/copper-type cytochrome/quinol oxidase subunit 2
MRDARLLWSGLALVVVALLGAILTTAPLPAGMGWVDHMGLHSQMMWPWQDEANAASEPIPGAAEVTLDADEFGFSPRTITLDADVPVNLTLINTGSLLHDLTIPELGFRIVASAGQRATGGLVPDRPGTYVFECSLPGHAQAGMTGTLIVTGP